MRKFDELPAVEREQISQRFEIPWTSFDLEVDENGVPFERIGGQLVACTVRNNNFHVHGNKQNGR